MSEFPALIMHNFIISGTALNNKKRNIFYTVQYIIGIRHYDIRSKKTQVKIY